MDKITFTINKEHYSLSGSDVSSDTSLNDYIRNHVNLRGTKAMCHEGGCGACIVSVSATHPASKEKKTFAVNSCLVHILSCHQWDISTIEGIGNRKDGYHKIQSRLANFNGTQCGFCTPGWVMNMYSLYEGKNKRLSIQEIENSFAGNMCRCTGYRPILDAFKTFAVDTDKYLLDKVKDMEDLDEMQCLKKCRLEPKKSFDDDWCVIEQKTSEKLVMNLNGGTWYKAYKIEDIFTILDKEGYDSYRLVAGNTGRGVYPIVDQPKVFIDISSIETLKDSLTDVNLVIGAGMTLTEVMETFKRWSEKAQEFKYLSLLRQHLDLVAHVPVRNIGTIGGNLAMKNHRHEFPSDIFIMLHTVQATVTLVGKNMEKSELTMDEFLLADLKNKLILNVKLPPLCSSYLVRTYKIMPRAQNAHAIVNAGFLFKLDSTNKIEMAHITYGSINARFTSAKKTETAIKGLNIYEESTLSTAIRALSDDVLPDEMPPEPSAKSRKILALNLFYKCILSICSDKVNTRYKSGGEVFNRPVSRGTQTFETDPTLWPLNKPMPKLESFIQCAGEAKYANDLPSAPREVFVSFVLSNVCQGQIDYFDTRESLKIPGVIAFLTAKDIPGKNSYTPTSVPWQEFDEEILASDKISYNGQPVGLIVAVTEKLANKVARLVKVVYKNVPTKKPILTIREARGAPKSENRVRQEVLIEAKSKGVNVTKVIKGSFRMKSQYHYTMEPQTCVVVPSEDTLDVYSSTQWMDLVHVAVSDCLNLPENSVNVIVRRLGGAYGGKASRSAMVATACSLVAYKLNRPARLAMSIQSNMHAVGKRQSCLCDYEVGINDEGTIQYANVIYYEDCGFCFNDTSGKEVVNTLTNLYDTSRWRIEGNSVLTDKASNTWCRAPGTTEATAIIEHIMERIANTVKKDSTEVKLSHIDDKHETVTDMVGSFITECQFDTRLESVQKFNTENCWRKRAIKLSLMSYPIGYVGNFGVTISIYHADGTVAISHGGIEMGQGINTKAAQVCAHILGIPIEKVKVKPSNNFVTPNAMASNGSITSDSVAFATIKASNIILERLQAVKDEMENANWENIVSEAFNKGINLQSNYMMSENDNLEGYNVYGVAVAEIELDVLTGNFQILRVDILEDTGQSMNPDIDVGQIEGAFIMGVGLWTSENLVYDQNTGRLVTDRTWTYKPPGAKDIPIDFRVSFRRNAPNPTGVLRSKATGEPALVTSVVVTHALHDAILEARKEFGYNDEDWVNVETPYTVENILEAISPRIESFKLT